MRSPFLGGSLLHTQPAGARAPLRTALAVAAALGLLVLAAAVPGRSVPAAPAAAPPPPIHPDRWPSPAWPLKEDPALEARITKLMAQMSVEQKVGQTVQGDIGSMTPEDVRKYHIGSVLAGGNSDPGGKYDASPAQWLALADAYYTASMQTDGTGPAIPIIFGIDAVHGQSNIVGATLFPHNIGLGATRDPDLMRKIGEITAVETRTTGMEWTFAPTVAVPQDDRWGRTYEGYSESPEVVASFAGKVVEGLQGVPGTPGFLDGSHVISSVKHFLGDGGTTDGKDQGDTRISEQQLRDIHGAGYPPAIATGAQTVMASFNSVNGVKMHGNTVMLTDVLKGQMHFGGFVVGDWNGHAQVPGCRKDDCPAAFNAGVDMLMAPDSWKGVYENALKAVKSGQIPMARLDDAVRRILRVKLRLGLFEAGKPSQRPLGGKFALLGAPEHRAVARQAVRESLVLLKNQQQVLPLKPQLKLLVAGDGANDMGKQAGGWTLNWQGTGTKRADYPNGTTIWEGLQQQVSAAGGSAELAVDGKFTTKPDVAVVVFGEHPYAEFQGDVATLLYKPGDDSDLDLIKSLKAQGIPVVAVFLSGRPLWVNREINAADAFVAAWLPGSEGGGIADVLLRKPDGSVQYDFHGKLSFSWPRTAVQFANNVGQKNYNPQFAFGYGLTYEDKGDLSRLSEVSGVSGAQAVGGVYLDRGKPATGINLILFGGTQTNLPAATFPAALADGSLKVTAIDDKAQEDARRFVWSGGGKAGMALVLPKPLDVSRESNGDVQLILTLKVDAAPGAAARIGVACGHDCGARVDLGKALAALPKGEWRTLGVPLKCFAAAGADLTRLERLPEIESDGALDLALSRIALGSSNDAQSVVDCPLH
ncbi:exo 1,3/1,4-beta-D-glucan glucohydrolase [Xanthomonas sp. PPL139]|uniref:glycoside hydrolase family 3 protein n=1 Tax=unclassified Xanthomonas TaxID=2643310 RepID=UPI0033ABFCA3